MHGNKNVKKRSFLT